MLKRNNAVFGRQYLMSEKNFNCRKLIEKSPWAESIGTLKKRQIHNIRFRLDELLKENLKYQTSGNERHTGLVFTAMALFETYVSEGLTQEEAIQLIEEPFYGYMEKCSEKLKRAAKLPFSLKLAGIWLKLSGRLKDTYGLKYSVDISTDKCLEITFKENLYEVLPEKYDMPQLEEIFVNGADMLLCGLSGFTAERKTKDEGGEKGYLITRNPKEQE